MRLWLFTLCLLCVRARDLHSSQANQGTYAPLLRGAVIDASTARPLPGVSVQVVSIENLSERQVATTNEAGRFVVRLIRLGAIVSQPGGRATFRLSCR